MGQKKSEQSVSCIMKTKDMNVPFPGKIFSMPITKTIHPFAKHLRFSWLGVYSRFTCKAVIFDDRMDNPTMNFRVENNSKFVRGKKKTIESIKKYLIFYYSLQEPTSMNRDYIFYVKNKAVDDLSKTVYGMLRDLENEAELDNCFFEVDVSCEELGLTW